MSIIDGAPGEIQQKKVIVPMDKFENAIREYGVMNACEWFGCSHDKVFVQHAIDWLKDRDHKYGPL